ncbi:unnamed protein product [Nippostrongylus brasiliensis]|uniref:F-box protein n=1 Tax=Nippostrongylus brasiliensis TaxID=27835 RepID=A0A0N4Y5F5_NIPBR|nr:unnamed protein product [Nippostrongylus brasiliensis]
MTKSKGRRLKEILWKCLVLGHRPPHEFDGSKWISAGGSDYPIDIMLGLEKVCNVYKVVIEVSEPFVPSKIELSLGLGDSKLETNYKNARLAEFSEPVSIEFDARRGHSGQQTTETKSAFLDSSGQYLWMLVHGPSNVRNNPDRQVGINSLTILGYTLNDDEVAEIDGGDAKTGKKEKGDFYKTRSVYWNLLESHCFSKQPLEALRNDGD